MSVTSQQGTEPSPSSSSDDISSSPASLRQTASISNVLKPKSERKDKALLTPVMVLEIYSCRNVAAASKTAESSEVGSRYTVSSKCVRDIWDRKTWAKTTRQLWTMEEKLEYDRGHPRGPGRPKGSKDSKPRKPRIRRKDPPYSQSSDSGSLLLGKEQGGQASGVPVDVCGASSPRKREEEMEVKRRNGSSESPRPASDVTDRSGSCDEGGGRDRDSTALCLNSNEQTTGSSPDMSCSIESPQWVAPPTAEGIQHYMQARDSSEEC
ncbi:hypothetical protein GUITHDRAFT_119212 [Guillardia theta CCMP2712]|uniref:Uncharacterized protein n=2 Tax=Guillardia theta TaxID=55529 RepID=L1IEG3_GUITC|nr:hypothetical protein GUITHDRAFT_119212 [Guillardia theta CCMP2712]EKX34666.1 hypothetical protein GUITHDRAFT_119212 [Guillardia theta CCMP2712]|mmetsp:Transcript_45549/g.143062  ORF Transcript_45549/g.143062 Transcript_45549/m.143062 type:complete len:266 (+) Transcript_45549:113-910(+)|eukprot:XP_005821646.1 hypothetical protein GUITHDRAFT_119212 [Guillardia theta CCMP2712]